MKSFQSENKRRATTSHAGGGSGRRVAAACGQRAGRFAVLILLAWLFASLLASPAPACAQLLPGSSEPTPDSIATRLGLPEGHSPKGALQRALAVPGWGQYYNRQYLKVPVAVAGLAGVVYGLIYTWDRYFLYRDAWRYRRGRGSNGYVPPPSAGEPDSYSGEFGGAEYREAYETVRQLLNQQLNTPIPPGQELPGVVQSRREQFNRWRELSVLGTGVFWILQVADAYVSAHLLGFDVDDLSVQVAPARQGLTTRLRVRL